MCFRGQAQIVPNELTNRKLNNYVELKSENQTKSVQPNMKPHTGAILETDVESLVNQ